MRATLHFEGRVFFSANATQALRTILDAAEATADGSCAVVWHRGLEHPVVTQFLQRRAAVRSGGCFAPAGSAWPLPSAEAALAEIVEQVRNLGAQKRGVIVLLSQVHWLSGDLLPIAALAKAIRAQAPETKIVIDGAQGPGNLRSAALSEIAGMITKQEIDAYFSCFHKWLDSSRTAGFAIVGSAFGDERCADWFYVNDYFGAAAHSAEANAGFISDTFAVEAATMAAQSFERHFSSRGEASVEQRLANTGRLTAALEASGKGRLISGSTSGHRTNIVSILVESERVSRVKLGLQQAGITLSSSDFGASGHVFRFSSPDVDVQAAHFARILDAMSRPS